jgi:hypothetical protein
MSRGLTGYISEKIDEILIASVSHYSAGCSLHVSFFQVAHLARQVQALQVLTEPNNVHKLMRQHVGQHRLEPHISPRGRFEDIVILEADSIKVSLVDHRRACLPAKTVAQSLGQGVIRNFRGAK